MPQPSANEKASQACAEISDAGSTEAAQLRSRVIALENLVIALFAQAPESQSRLGREMAAFISPRAGCTPHHLTLGAAFEMRSLLDRAVQFRASPVAE